MTNDELNEKMREALRALVSEDGELLERNASERSIGARLAAKLTSLFPEYHVDVEYDRHGLDSKSVDLPSVCRGGGRRRIIPDIVIHRRGHDEENLLAIEIKKETNRESRSCDRAKLEAMKRELGYFAGVLIELPAGPGATERSVLLHWL
jgi:hypothetical protein